MVIIMITIIVVIIGSTTDEQTFSVASLSLSVKSDEFKATPPLFRLLFWLFIIAIAAK